jgi:sugar/nucleoside kinase (ribokinase family)
VVDAVGAGDALLSYATLSMVATKSNVISSILGALAAAVACEHDGNEPVKPEDVLKKLNALEKRSRFE